MAPVKQEDSKTVTETAPVPWSLENELKENEKLRLEDINMLKELCLSIPNVNPASLTDEFLVALLHSNDYNLDGARTTAEIHFEIVQSVPEVFANREMESDEIEKALRVRSFTPLPRKTPEGHRIMCQQLRNRDHSVFSFPAHWKAEFLTLHSSTHEEPTCPGYVFICHADGYGFRHSLKFNFFLTKKIMRYLQEGIPLRLHQIYVLNTCSFTHKFLQLFKPLVNPEFWKILKFFPVGDTMKLHESIPKECLPKEYGGDLPDLETLLQNQLTWLRKIQPKVDAVTTNN